MVITCFPSVFRRTFPIPFPESSAARILYPSNRQIRQGAILILTSCTGPSCLRRPDWQWHCVETKPREITGYFVNFEPQGGGNSSAQGIALGKRFQSNLSPVGAKLKILSRAPTGLHYFFCHVPRAMPWANELCPFGALSQNAKPYKIQSICSVSSERNAIGAYRPRLV